MTRRDFQLIADCIRETRETFGNYPPVNQIIREFSRRLPETNPRFDAGRFERACGEAVMPAK